MEQSPRDVLNGIRSYIMIFKSSIDPANGADGSSAVSSARFNGFKDLQDVFKGKYKQQYDDAAYNLFMELRKKTGMVDNMETSMHIVCTRNKRKGVHVHVL
jgi:hypothetical protein